jgi:hypothetical protein
MCTTSKVKGQRSVDMKQVAFSIYRLARRWSCHFLEKIYQTPGHLTVNLTLSIKRAEGEKLNNGHLKREGQRILCAAKIGPAS